MDYENSYLGNLSHALSQVGNSLCGGNANISISGQIGSNITRISKYWRFLKKMVDFTFFPLDGNNHCLKAWEKQNHEKHKRINFLGRVIMFIIVFFSCLVLNIIIWPAHLLKRLVQWVYLQVAKAF